MPARPRQRKAPDASAVSEGESQKAIRSRAKNCCAFCGELVGLFPASNLYACVNPRMQLAPCKNEPPNFRPGLAIRAQLGPLLPDYAPCPACAAPRHNA